jgi:hypothetical protein
MQDVARASKLTELKEEIYGKAGPVLRRSIGQGSKEDQDRQARRADAEMVSYAPDTD